MNTTLDSVRRIAKLSDHAATLVREREAAACVVLVIEGNGQTSMGWYVESATPEEVQSALCAAICENAKTAGRN